MRHFSQIGLQGGLALHFPFINPGKSSLSGSTKDKFEN